MVMFKDREIGFVNMTNIIEEKDNKTIYAEYVNCYLGQWYPGQVRNKHFLSLHFKIFKMLSIEGEWLTCDWLI